MLKIIIVSVVSFIELFILTKLSGNKELAQATMFDYILGITIGSIAAEMSTSLDSFKETAIAMLVYGVISIALSIGTNKSIKLRRFIYGTSYILYDNGKLYKENFKKSKTDLNEFLMKCRMNGFYNIADIQTAILETNGNLSVLPKSISRPVTPNDLNLSPDQDTIFYSIIIDGKIIKENLKNSGHDINWLKKNLKNNGYSNENEIFLALCDKSNTLEIYPKLSKEIKHDFTK